MEKVSLVITPNIRKKCKKTKLIPLYLRIGVKREKTEASLQIFLTEDELAQWNPILMKVDVRDSNVNRKLAKLDALIEEVKTRHYLTLHHLSPIEIKKEILGEDESDDETRNTILINYMENYYKTKVIPNQSISLGTKKNYNKSINHFRNFLNLHKIDTIKLFQFSKKHALNFKDFLLMDNDVINKKKLRQTSASGVVKKIKVIFKRALEEELITRSPFDGISFKLEYSGNFT